uniref:LIM zinc-binding domain-containing protein n=1 Tax=Acrobeloides nanus TaxID=290746 RepID=A0A914E7X2_9BILA
MLREIRSVAKSKMPFKPVEHAKCPKCGKSVYAAEEMVAGGYKWHKFCFKCNMCNKLLDSMNCCEHQAELYCKQCHGRKYGPKGVGFGIGAGALTMDTGEQFGNKEVEMTNRPMTAEAFTAPINPQHR